MTTPLGAVLAERIARSGPIPVADFMAAALGDPRFGYYTQRAPFGAAGDFVTAPEISQMFGEIIGLWCISLFEQMGEPPRFRLIELGPGRGTLMADLWRAAKIRPAFRAAARIHLVETSPRLRTAQREALSGVAADWHETFPQAAQAEPGTPLIVIANEFFDALPVHQVMRTGRGWRERMVAYDPETGSFEFAAADSETPVCALVPSALGDAPPGAIYEVSIAARDAMAEIAREIVASGGGALVVDYGHVRCGLGDTLQSVRAHRYHDVLADPGLADITAHVDFAALADAARACGARVCGPLAQGAFLKRLGIEARAETILTRASPDQSREIAAAFKRLIDADNMGRLFKALAVTHPKLSAAGFET
ncbi:MAG TPA: SAM-dependent methyltransferase [Alphaproteobacteria bacterium]|nr:SAM-dependent methyltransferase [Alphaproteobacteria bacterium]